MKVYLLSGSIFSAKDGPHKCHVKDVFASHKEAADCMEQLINDYTKDRLLYFSNFPMDIHQEYDGNLIKHYSAVADFDMREERGRRGWLWARLDGLFQSSQINWDNVLSETPGIISTLLTQLSIREITL